MFSRSTNTMSTFIKLNYAQFNRNSLHAMMALISNTNTYFVLFPVCKPKFDPNLNHNLVSKPMFSWSMNTLSTFIKLYNAQFNRNGLHATMVLISNAKSINSFSATDRG